jgi:hypothetical protein
MSSRLELLAAIRFADRDAEQLAEEGPQLRQPVLAAVVAGVGAVARRGSPRRRADREGRSTGRAARPTACPGVRSSGQLAWPAGSP